MQLNELTAITPIDGRYRKQVSYLANYFSEFALIKYRLYVEIQYFIALCKMPLPQLVSFDSSKFTELLSWFDNFSLEDAQRIKDIEKTTNHDVKAVEYFLKEKFDACGLSSYKEFIHFGLTSQDINNTATPLLLKKAMQEHYFSAIDGLVDSIVNLAEEWKQIPMLAHTHGQPASPTLLGKELMVFVERLHKQLGMLYIIPYAAKFGGATGNFNAHYAAYPQIKWDEFANAFVNHVLDLERSQTTTQIEHYDYLAALFDNIKRINTILIDFCRDIWTYVSMNYFKQRINENEVGSSAMPHKVNPIDFENAEGNLMLANALFEFLSAKLPISRLQRDLTDSTVLRNIGSPIAHSMIAYKSINKGLNKLMVNKPSIDNDLNQNWMVVAEGIQTILRREGIEGAYESLKKLTRTNNVITKEDIHTFIDKLNISDAIKAELKQLSPFNYTGKH
ncbi:MAG TPA: adenylosuccinate lyase [Bacteroidales bacterium]|nr:adenylosuccinate lyase [Bacteroidales bacterium]